MTPADHTRLEKLTNLIFNADNWMHDQEGLGDCDPENHVLRLLARDLALKIIREFSL